MKRSDLLPLLLSFFSWNMIRAFSCISSSQINLFRERFDWESLGGLGKSLFNYEKFEYSLASILAIRQKRGEQRRAGVGNPFFFASSLLLAPSIQLTFSRRPPGRNVTICVMNFPRTLAGWSRWRKMRLARVESREGWEKKVWREEVKREKSFFTFFLFLQTIDNVSLPPSSCFRVWVARRWIYWISTKTAFNLL